MTSDASRTEIIHTDCKHFRGDIPCRPHKKHGVKCGACTHYEPREDIVLIIKLGAIGDVIRTTPLMRRLRRERPKASIWWLTIYPDVLPDDVDCKLRFSPEAILRIQATEFATVINLDKEPEACALTKMAVAGEKIGFTLRNGKPAPIDERASHKYMTGLFDDVNKANVKSYPQEIFEICGWEFKGEEYILTADPSYEFDLPDSATLIGLNTGCGDRWTSRLWPDTSWIELIEKLQNSGYTPLLLGGPQEDEKNRRFAAATGALYLGHFPLQQFIALVDRCAAVVTAVTMSMHLAIGLGKPLILFVNIFNPHEFELYGRGEILTPERECRCYFQGVCDNEEYFCMESLNADRVMQALNNAVAEPAS